MNIAIVGTGYVGLVTGACFAKMGHNVWCVDIDQKKIEGLRNGIIPIYEPGLSDIVKKYSKKGTLNFVTDLAECIDVVSVVFSAVGTPPNEDGSADLKYVLAVARRFGELVSHYSVFVTKSTVPVGTAKKVEEEINKALKKRNEFGKVAFSVASNPEFLKEGSAVSDFLKPDRIVIGTSDATAESILSTLYAPFVVDNPDKLIVTDVPSAEMIKYASNSMLATRISFMNEIANLCEKVGANVDSVRRGVGADTRIGKKFLYAGCGYGGSCFPKDVKALIQTGFENDEPMFVLNAVEMVNNHQKTILFNKLSKHINVSGKRIAVLGLAFKPNTDDMREAPSIVLIRELLSAGATVVATDPIAINVAKKIFPNIEYCDNELCALSEADAAVLVTEWDEYRGIRWNEIKKVNKNLSVLVDGRNIYNREDIEFEGIAYECIGK